MPNVKLQAATVIEGKQYLQEHSVVSLLLFSPKKTTY